MQVGAELYGHAGIESDCEVCCLMLDTLVAADVAQVHLDLGHVGVFRSLTRQAGLDAGAETVLQSALQRKAADEIVAATRAARVAAKWEVMLTELAGLHGGEETIAAARAAMSGAGPAVNHCIDQLEKLAEAIQLRNPNVPVHFDFAELRGYNYHTGVLFSALVPGVGSEVARGGRYDEIGNVFGRARPATGFSTDLKQLMMLSEPDNAANANGARSAILAPWSNEPELLQEIDRLRKIGRRVIMALPGQVPGQDQDGASGVLEKVDGTWTAVERTS
jgi:ATP phosphoribosyltransferase regulatory subunit